MKIFYVKSCKYWVRSHQFDHYWDSVSYADGFNDSREKYSHTHTEAEVEPEQREYVKCFGYEYDPTTEELHISQVVWRHKGVAQHNSYWTRKLRRSHLKTVEKRLVDTDKCVVRKVSREDWDKSVESGREKLVQKQFYRHFEK